MTDEPNTSTIETIAVYPRVDIAALGTENLVDVEIVTSQGDFVTNCDSDLIEKGEGPKIDEESSTKK